MSVNPFWQEPVRNEPRNPEISQEMIDLSHTDKKVSKFKTVINLPEVLQENLQPGDIIISYCNKIAGWKDFAILMGQKFKEGKRNEHKYCHVAIYLGNGKIAEAVDGTLIDGIDIKVNKISGQRFAKNLDEYRVFRPKGHLNDVALLGVQIARESPTESKLGGFYNYESAIFSSFREAKKITKKSIENFFRASLFAHNGEIPIEMENQKIFIVLI